MKQNYSYKPGDIVKFRWLNNRFTGTVIDYKPRLTNYYKEPYYQIRSGDIDYPVPESDIITQRR